MLLSGDPREVFSKD